MKLITFYLTQYMQYIFHVVNIKVIHKLFYICCTKSSQSGVYFTLRALLNGLATLQVLNSHMWLVATILDSTAHI